MAIYIVKPWYKQPAPVLGIYGAEWDGSSNPAWTRTDDAVDFADPVPQMSDGNGGWIGGSSPFDRIMPWAGMRIVEDSEAGTLVEIPKFWYKWTRSGEDDIAMKLQIANYPETGFHVSPAHADRGDGVGERDYAYVGRYKCISSSLNPYKSATGYVAATSISITTFGTDIHNLGSAVWQWDFAMWWTINMLYLVEFANWNSQEKIGYGGTNSLKMGYTDIMPYHTGTIRTAKYDFTGGVQYRYIEALWEKTNTFIAGIDIDYANDNAVYIYKNPADFESRSNGVAVGIAPLYAGYTKYWTNPIVTGFEYALYPRVVATAGMDGTTYTCDYYRRTSNRDIISCSSPAGKEGTIKQSGLFYLAVTQSVSSIDSGFGARLMKLPPSRLVA